MSKRIKILSSILLAILAISCSLPHEPGPQPITIVETDSSPRIVVFAVFRPDSGKSFIVISGSYNLDEAVRNPEDMTWPEPTVTVEDSITGEIFDFYDEEDDSSYYFENEGFAAQVGHTYEVIVTAPEYETLIGSTTVPVAPDVANYTMGEDNLTVTINTQPKIHSYEVHLNMADDTSIIKTIKWNSDAQISTDFTWSNAYQQPVDFVVYGYERNLSEYLGTTISIKPQSYQPMNYDVEGGYGVVGALNSLEVDLPADYDQFFTSQTLRFDYDHTGISTEEHIAIDGVRLEGPWPGSKVNLIDNTNLGKFLFEVYDLASNTLIYSRGFASIYGEWETTGEARDGIWRSISESQRFPEPKLPVKLVLNKRDETGKFVPIYSTEVDPASRFVNRSAISPVGKVWTVFANGDPATKVDILILSDGYKRSERMIFHKDVKRFVDDLFATEPFKSRKSDFNVRAIDIPSVESGISNPRKNVWRDNPLGLSYNSFDSDRYVLTMDNIAVRDIAAQAPYDAVIIVNNDDKYGGGGIFNLYATVGAHTGPAAYVFVHEFGHSFAGLADEYYTSDVAYEEFQPVDVEPWEVNATVQTTRKNLKWNHLVDADTPIITPWNKAAYDSASYAYQQVRRAKLATGAGEADMDALFAEIKAITKPMLEGEKYFGKVGAFEGALYEAQGFYRPEVDCIMFSRNPRNFCAVCAAGISTVIDLYAK
jgi:hypothetical protein